REREAARHRRDHHGRDVHLGARADAQLQPDFRERRQRRGGLDAEPARREAVRPFRLELLGSVEDDGEVPRARHGHFHDARMMRQIRYPPALRREEALVSAIPSPPAARAVPYRTVVHGEERVDPFHWMREKTSPEVTAYLEAENAYADAVMKPTE